MKSIPIEIGDVIKLKKRFEKTSKYALIIDIRKAEGQGDMGWISFDYLIMTDSGTFSNISSSCVESVFKINQFPLVLFQGD